MSQPQEYDLEQIKREMRIVKDKIPKSEGLQDIILDETCPSVIFLWSGGERTGLTFSEFRLEYIHFLKGRVMLAEKHELMTPSERVSLGDHLKLAKKKGVQVALSDDGQSLRYLHSNGDLIFSRPVTEFYET